MEDKSLNRPVLERIAKEVMGIEDPDAIEAFVNEFVFSMLLD